MYYVLMFIVVPVLSIWAWEICKFLFRGKPCGEGLDPIKFNMTVGCERRHSHRGMHIFTNRYGDQIAWEGEKSPRIQWVAGTGKGV